MSNNKSIREVCLQDDRVFQMLGDFFKKNDSLIALSVRDSEIGADSVRHLSLALESCNKSLKSICFSSCHGGMNGFTLQR